MPPTAATTPNLSASADANVELPAPGMPDTAITNGCARMTNGCARVFSDS